MHFYSRHIGDWRVATGKLTRVQRDIYGDLIDTYYDREQPLTSDFEMLAEDHGCRSEEEVAALRYILKRYFKLDGNVYRHERCDEELAAFHHRSELARASSRLGVEARANKRRRNGPSDGPNGQPPGQPNDHPPSTGGQPSGDLPNTQYPIEKKTDPIGSVKESGAAAPTDPPPAQPQAGGQVALVDEPPPEKAQRPARKCPKGFVVTSEMVAWAATKCPLLSVTDIERETETFKDYTFGRAITDWPGAWRNWLRREQKNREQRAPRGSTADRNSRRDEFMDRLMGGQQGEQGGTGEQGFIDVESHVVGDGQDDPPQA